MMHFLGGLVVSGVVLWTVVRFTTLSGAHTRYLLYISLISALVIGIGWEFFEYLNGMYVGQANIVTDTAIDLVMDTLGAVVSWVGVRFLLTRRITRI